MVDGVVAEPVERGDEVAWRVFAPEGAGAAAFGVVGVEKGGRGGGVGGEGGVGLGGAAG